jgi:ParB-like chromosome segregation protein Spo0J
VGQQVLADARRLTEARALWTGVMARLDPPVEVPVDALLPADSPRLRGENPEHVRTLADSAAVLPPILVHRPTRRVIDGMHRLRAAAIRAQATVAVQFVDGSPQAAFVIGVMANATHGLPLSLADRRAAAARIVASHPQWSDRAVASATGLAPKTVGAIRAQAADGAGAPVARVGLDGRVRPLSSADGRRRASQIITDNPTAPLREVARAAGISAATAHDVRERMHRGEDPVPAKVRSTSVRFGRRQTPVPDPASVLRTLRADPSLRFTESGRALLGWLNTQVAGMDGWRDLVPAIPAHCSYAVADLARVCADRWLALAEDLARRTDATP